ncbi:MAG: hypothetical protein C0429_15195 [Sphingopyxis sp.]|nr:hypothetical protein [Sphingopyxis sp.]
MEPNNALNVEQMTEETGAQALARKLLQPTLKNAAAASAFMGKMMGNDLDLPGIGDYADHVHISARDAAEGDLAIASKILAAQAITLDSMFAELARRAANNLGDYISAAERYGRLALKAQSNCRATLETLAKLHQPREQTVRHVHVNEGGQAVIADQFHNHTGGAENVKSVNQSNATGPTSISGALLGKDAAGNRVPVSSRKREEEVPNARRHQSGCAKGEP